MRQELHLHRVTFWILIALLIPVIASVIRLHPSLADQKTEALTSLVIVALAAAVFIVMGTVEGMIALQFGGRHTRELLGYLLLGLLSLGCGVYLAISDSATIRTIALVSAPHALLFGMAELRLAHHLSRHPSYQTALTFGGIVELSLGGILMLSSRFSSQETATVLGFVGIMSILQLLPLVFYWSKVQRVVRS